MNIIVEVGGKNKALTINEAKRLCRKMLNSVNQFEFKIDGKFYIIYVSEAKKICDTIHKYLYS